MHALSILHHVLSTSFPEIHAKRLASLLAEVNDSVFLMIQWHYRPCWLPVCSACNWAGRC
jgi:hypothetical protein